MSDHPEGQVLLDFPEQFESERLIIRAPLWGDGASNNEAIKESIEELRPWMPWASKIPSVEESEINIRMSRLEFLERKDLRLLLTLKDGGTIIGSSGLHRIGWKARKFEIGYWIRTSYAKQGFMTEAVNAIADFAITQLKANRIEIRCDERNKRSAHVAQRCGFTLEGILRSEVCGVDGQLTNTMVFSKIRGIEF